MTIRIKMTWHMNGKTKSETDDKSNEEDVNKTETIVVDHYM